MEEDVFIQISNKIKNCRREKNITVQELATKSEVSKGFISQIENSRTIPSLMVLLEIIKALDIDLNTFFKDIGFKKGRAPILVKRHDQFEYFEKEDALGFHYHRIFTQSFKNSTVDFVLLTLDPKSSRPLVTTDAFEFKYILSGEVKFIFEDQQLELSAGDSILFDGRIPHTPQNLGKKKVVMIAVYFFEENV